MSLPPRGHCAASALIPQGAARPAQRRRTPGILPGSLPPTGVEPLDSQPSDAASPNSPGTDVSPAAGPAPVLIVNTPEASAAPAADTGRPFTIGWNH